MGRVSGRSCIVTGSARGIGRAIGEALLDEGADVCFADIDSASAELAARENEDRAQRNGGKVAWAGVDVTKREEVRDMIAAAVSAFGPTPSTRPDSEVPTIAQRSVSFFFF